MHLIDDVAKLRIIYNDESGASATKLVRSDAGGYGADNTALGLDFRTGRGAVRVPTQGAENETGKN